MGRLADQRADALVNQPFYSLLDIVDFQIVTAFQLIDDHLAGERAPHGILRERARDFFFNRSDCRFAGVVVAGAKRNHQNRFLVRIAFFYFSLLCRGAFRLGFFRRGRL